MPDLQFLEPASFGPSTLPFSQGVRAGNLLFIAGQGPVDDDGNLAGAGDIREQTRVTLDRVRRVCEEAGGDLSNVVTATVFLTDLANFGAYNEAWVEAFGDHRPARATVQAGLLFDMLVEVQAIAVSRARSAAVARRHQSIGRPSRKKPPVGPSSGSVAAHTMPAAPSATGRPPAPPMSVATQPGQTALTRIRSPRSSAARMRVSALSAAFDVR